MVEGVRGMLKPVEYMLVLQVYGLEDGSHVKLQTQRCVFDILVLQRMERIPGGHLASSSRVISSLRDPVSTNQMEHDIGPTSSLGVLAHTSTHPHTDVHTVNTYTCLCATPNRKWLKVSWESRGLPRANQVMDHG